MSGPLNPPVATFILFKMVNVMKGVLIECDPAMKQFLLHLDEKVSLMYVLMNIGRYESIGWIKFVKYLQN